MACITFLKNKLMQERDFEGRIWASQESGSKRKWEASNEQNGCFSPRTTSWFGMFISVIHLALGGRARSQACTAASWPRVSKERRDGSWIGRTQLATVQRSVTWSSFPHSCTAPIVSLNLNVGVCEVSVLFFHEGTDFSFWWFLVPGLRQPPLVWGCGPVTQPCHRTTQPPLSCHWVPGGKDLTAVIL